MKCPPNKVKGVLLGVGGPGRWSVKLGEASGAGQQDRSQRCGQGVGTAGRRRCWGGRGTPLRAREGAGARPHAEGAWRLCGRAAPFSGTTLFPAGGQALIAPCTSPPSEAFPAADARKSLVSVVRGAPGLHRCRPVRFLPLR